MNVTWRNLDCDWSRVASSSGGGGLDDDDMVMEWTPIQTKRLRPDSS